MVETTYKAPNMLKICEFAPYKNMSYSLANIQSGIGVISTLMMPLSINGICHGWSHNMLTYYIRQCIYIICYYYFCTDILVIVISAHKSILYTQFQTIIKQYSPKHMMLDGCHLPSLSDYSQWAHVPDLL